MSVMGVINDNLGVMGVICRIFNTENDWRATLIIKNVWRATQIMINDWRATQMPPTQMPRNATQKRRNANATTMPSVL
jgi:hypothetical protein